MMSVTESSSAAPRPDHLRPVRIDRCGACPEPDRERGGEPADGVGGVGVQRRIRATMSFQGDERAGDESCSRSRRQLAIVIAVAAKRNSRMPTSLASVASTRSVSATGVTTGLLAAWTTCHGPGPDAAGP